MRIAPILLAIAFALVGCEAIAGYEDLPRVAAGDAAAGGAKPADASSTSDATTPDATTTPCSSCPRGATCRTDRCVCPFGTTECGDACVALAFDDGNCGACGRACAASERCLFGACR